MEAAAYDRMAKDVADTQEQSGRQYVDVANEESQPKVDPVRKVRKSHLKAKTDGGLKPKEGLAELRKDA